MTKIEIYFDDLVEAKQKELLQKAMYHGSEDVPVAVLYVEEEEQDEKDL